jgi:hypothetical protein
MCGRLTEKEVLIMKEIETTEEIVRDAFKIIMDNINNAFDEYMKVYPESIIDSDDIVQTLSDLIVSFAAQYPQIHYTAVHKIYEQIREEEKSKFKIIRNEEST